MYSEQEQEQIDVLVLKLSQGDSISEQINFNAGSHIADLLAENGFKSKQMYSTSSAASYESKWSNGKGLMVDIHVGHLFGTYTDVSSYKGW